MKPILTIGTINRNNSKGLERTIASVARQKCGGLEYVVIDGNSSDGSVDVIRANTAKIDYWVSEPDRGISDAFNKVIGSANAAWVMLLNAGDVLRDDSITRIFDALMTNARVDIVCGRTLALSNSGNHKVLVPNASKLPLEMSIPHPSSIVNKTLYEKVGGYGLEYRIAMDYAFFLKARAANARFIELEDVYVEMEDGGVSNQSAFSRNRDSWEARNGAGIGLVANSYAFVRRLSRDLLSKAFK